MDCRSKLRGALAHDRFSLIVMPTEQCNFRCLYCYETFTRGLMSDETVSAVCKLLTLRIKGGVRHLNIQWFGGEPLLGCRVIEKIMIHAQAEMASVGGFLSGSMTTNGYLFDDKRRKALLNLGVNKFQITLDGARSDHDNTRRSKCGGKTFDNIIYNLHSALASDDDFTIIIRIHLTQKSIDDIIPFTKYLKETFGDDRRFSFFVRGISELASDRKTHGLSPDQEEAENKLTIAKKILNSQIDATTERNTQPVAKAIECCYASLPTSLVIRSDGEIAKCTVRLEDDFNRIGRINHDGTLLIDGEKLSYWTRGLLTGAPKILRCPAQNGQ